MAKKENDNMEVAVHQLFPIPVAFTNIGRPLSKKEKDLFSY